MYKFCNYDLSLEITKVQSSISTLIRHGGTAILCKVSVNESSKYSMDLSVDYLERSYAINKIPGGFNKKEGRQKDNELVISRLVDRSIRSTIDASFQYEIKVVLIVLSYSKQCPVEPLCITAASASLVAAGVPCNPVVGVNLENSDGWKIGGQRGRQSVIIAGNAYGVSCISYAGKEASANEIIHCLNTAYPKIPQLMDFIRSLTDKIEKPIYCSPNLENKGVFVDGKKILEAYLKKDNTLLDQQKSAFMVNWEKGLGERKWYQICRNVLRSYVLWSRKRVGETRDLDTIRNINVETNYLQTHGSCLFSRGETSVLCVTTVGNSNECQIYETLDGNDQRKFIVHYNNICDMDKILSTSRREIGHAELARDALKPYVNEDKLVRLVSEVLTSDGSSSMATVTGGCLALKNAGIKIPEVVAGITVGVILEGLSTVFLTDITYLEDAFISDMDFKIAGSRKGINAIQMDLKIPFLPWNVLENTITYGFKALEKICKMVEAANNNAYRGLIEGRPDNRGYDRVVENKVNDTRNDNRIDNRVSDSRTDIKIIDNKNDNSNQQKVDLYPGLRDVSKDLPKENYKRKEFKETKAPAAKKVIEIPEDAYPIRLKESLLIKFKKSIEDLKVKTASELFFRGNSIYIKSDNLDSCVKEVLKQLFAEQNKEGKTLYYGAVGQIQDKNVEIELLDKSIISIKKANLPNDIKTGDPLALTKGRSWGFFAKM